MIGIPDFSFLFYSSPLPQWVYEPNTFHILDVNKAAIDHYGYSKEEFLTLTIIELCPKEEIPKVIGAHDGIDTLEGNIEFGTFTHLKKNGEIIRAVVNGHKVNFQGKNCIISVCQDDTILQKQLLELQESEKKLKAASEIAKIGYWKLDIPTNLLFWSDKVFEMWDVKKEDVEISYDFFINSIHPDDIALFKREEEAALAGLKELNFAHRIILPNGDIKWVHEMGRLNKKTEETPTTFEGTVQDITLQKKEEQHLRLLESVVTHTNDAVLITEAEPQDAPGPRIIYVNEAFTRMTGYTAEEVIGKSPRILQGPKSDRNELSRLGKALRNWKPCEITTVNYKKNGEEFWINISVSPVANEKGWYTHWIAIERDITASKNEQFQKELLSQISTVFNLTTDLYQALNELNQITASIGNFSFCEIWLPSNYKNKLRLFASFSSSSEGQSFYDYSETVIETEIGQGLQGLVWINNEPLLWGTADIKNSFIRSDAAKKAAIKSAMGIPLKHQDELVGIMLVGSNFDNNVLKPHFPVLTELGKSIGTEIKRKRLENDQHHLFEALPDLICLTDFSGKFLKINKAGCTILGYEEEKILDANLNSFIHPADVVIFSKAMQRLKSEDTIFKFENRYITKTGKTIWLSWHCNIIKEEGVIYATAKDITDEKKLREVVSDASELATIGGWEIDLINNELIWSDIIYQIYEADPKTFIPEVASAIDFYREDHKEYVTDAIQKSIETGESFDFEAALISTKGNEKWVRAIGQAEMVNGTCVRVFGSFQEITKIKETEHRLKTITNDLPGVTFQYYIYSDNTDKLVSVSKASYRIWGLSPEVCENNNKLVWDQIKKGGDIEQVFKDIKHSSKTITQWNSKWKNVLPNGEVRWHEGFGTPYRLPDGSVLFNSMIFDITDKVNASQLYEEASELAKIGNWELDLLSKDETDAMYWSPMVKKILEVDDDYNPSFSGGLEFYKDESKARLEIAVETLIKVGIEFDEELEIITKTRKEKWIRCIGKSQQVDGKSIKIFGSFQDIDSMKTTELRVKEILGSISDAFYALDKHWNFTYYNKEAENLLKQKSSDVLGKNIWKVFAPAKGTELETVYRKVAKTEKPINFEYFYPGDGSWYELNVYPSNGGVSSYFKNIDERKKVAFELNKAFEEKNKILESIGDAFFAVGKDWAVTYWNKEAEKVLGRKREEILGKNLWEVYPDAVELDFYKQYHNAMASGETITFEEFYPTLKIWFEVSAYPSGEGLSVYFKDVTLRKETDTRILQANERFEKVTQATTDAIWDWDIENDVFYRGDGFEKLFGYEVNKILKNQDFWQDRFHPKDTHKIQSSLEETINDPSLDFWEQEYRIIHQSSDIKTVVDKGVIIRNKKGKATRMIGAITDISERIKYENELQELNKILKKNVKELQISNEQLEQFAFIASHDLQEPLRMISSFLNQIERKYGDQLDDKAHQYIHFATDGAKRMKQIILDLLEYSRAGTLADTIDSINLNELIADYRVLRRRLIKEKRAKIIVNSLPNVKCFKAPLVQTLHCLLDNAMKYSKENQPPMIEISTLETDAYWQVSIGDNGIGIDSQFFDKIFIIFQRLHNRDQFGGTGIGLSIAKKHIESWGGKIWIESELGKGSTFYFTIDKNIV